MANFNLWSRLPNFFSTASGPVNGEDWGYSNVSDGGAPIWVDTETPAASYAPGQPENYTIVLTSQDWLGDEQSLVTVTTEANIVNPFSSKSASFGNMGAGTIFSSNATTGTGGVLYWKASTTVGDYALEFQPITTTYVTAPSSGPNTVLSGAPVTMDAAIASPTDWTFEAGSATTLVLAYTTAVTSTTENLWYQGFNNAGSATTAPVKVASDIPDSSQFYVAYTSSGGYGYRFTVIDGAETGVYGGSFNAATGALGAPTELIAIPSFTSLTGLESRLLSSGSSLRFVEGVESGQDVLQAFVSATSTPSASFALTSADDQFAITSVYDPGNGQLDYTVLAYTDNNKVHLELLNASGNQIGADYVVADLTSFDRLHTLTGSGLGSDTRVELDYTATDPSGGNEIEGVIYDTATGPYVYTLGSAGNNEYDGSPFDDTITDAPGVYFVDGGGGTDTFVATMFTPSEVSVTINPQGNVVMSDGKGDVDKLKRFSIIELSGATIAISGNTLTQTNTDGSEVVSTFNITGQNYTTTIKTLDKNGNKTSLEYEGMTGTPYDAITYFFSGTAATGYTKSGWDTFYTGQSSGLAQIDFDGSGNLVEELYEYGGTTNGALASLEIDYVAGQEADSLYTYVGPGGSSFTQAVYEFDNNNNYVGATYTFTGQTYDKVQASFTTGTSPKLTETTYSDYTGTGGPNDVSYFYTTAGALTGVQETFTGITGQAYTSDSVLYNASGVAIASQYQGYTTKPFSTLTYFDNSSGATQEIVRDFSTGGSIDGQVYDSNQTIDNASNALLATTYHLDNGGNMYVGLGSNETSPTFGGSGVTPNAAELAYAAPGGDWTITGGGTGETFSFASLFNTAAITDYGASVTAKAPDQITLAASDFGGWTTFFGEGVASGAGGANTTFTSTVTGDKLTLDGVTLAQLGSMSGDFHFV
jgi:hypothetical protein